MVEATSIENTLFPVPLLKVLVLGWFELSPGQYRCLGPGLGEVLVLATGEETSPSPGPGQSRSWLLKQTQSWSRYWTLIRVSQGPGPGPGPKLLGTDHVWSGCSGNRYDKINQKN